MSSQGGSQRVPLDIFLNKFLSGTPYLARGAEISTDEMTLSHLIEPKHTERQIALQFQLPGSDEIIYAEAEVIEQWETAEQRTSSTVRFTSMAEHHRRLICAYVSSAYTQ